jgi:hypothetical protein
MLQVSSASRRHFALHLREIFLKRGAPVRDRLFCCDLIHDMTTGQRPTISVHKEESRETRLNFL